MLDHIDLTDIHRTFYSITEEHTFLTSTHRPLSRKGHMLGHKISLNNLRKLQSHQESFPTRMV